MESLDAKPSATELEARIVSRLREFSGIALRMLDGMWISSGPHAGLHCFRVLPGESGELRQDGESLRYSLIVWIGLLSVRGKAVLETAEWQLAASRFADIVDRTLSKLTLGELGLLLWVGHLTGGGWVQTVLDDAQRTYKPEWTRSDTLEVGWMLSGLMQHHRSTGVKSPLIDKIARRIKSCYNPATCLFTFFPYRYSTFYTGSRYRKVLGSFASQVYSLFALSDYLMSFPDAEAAEMICRCADRICDLQGPDGEWWWIYDVRDGSVAMDFPVYSVHQDSMGPMALLKVMQASGTKPAKHIAAISKGTEHLFQYRGSSPADTFIDTEYPIIWRAAVREMPGEDPALLPFGLSQVERHELFRRGWPQPFRRRQDLSGRPQRMLKEARPYCAGWILLAYSLACELSGVSGDL